MMSKTDATKNLGEPMCSRRVSSSCLLSALCNPIIYSKGKINVPYSGGSFLAILVQFITI